MATFLVGTIMPGFLQGLFFVQGGFPDHTLVISGEFTENPRSSRNLAGGGCGRSLDRGTGLSGEGGKGRPEG